MKDGHNHERISVVYFENASGYIIVAPDSKHPTPTGFERRECHTLREIAALTRRVNLQDTDKFSRLMAKDRAQMRSRHEQIRSKLMQRLLAVDCGRMEALFIRRAFQYLAQKEEEMTRCEVNGFFVQR